MTSLSPSQRDQVSAHLWIAETEAARASEGDPASWDDNLAAAYYGLCLAPTWEPDNFASYATTACRHQIQRDRVVFRRCHVGRCVITYGDPQDRPGLTDDPSHALIAKEASQWLARAITGLTPLQQRVICRRLQGWPVRAIQDELKVSRIAVARTLRRAIEQLRAWAG